MRCIEMIPGYGYIANPDLDPETTNTFEIGMKKQIGTKTNLTMSVYHAKTKDMIIAVKRADGKRWYVNQDQARRIGAELDVNHTFGQFFSAYANYSYEQAKDENGDRIYSIPVIFSIQAFNITEKNGMPIWRDSTSADAMNRETWRTDSTPKMPYSR